MRTPVVDRSSRVRFFDFPKPIRSHDDQRRFAVSALAFDDQFDIDALIDSDENGASGNNKRKSASQNTLGDGGDERALVRIRLHWFLARL